MAKELRFSCDKCKDEISYGYTIILDVFEANKSGAKMQSARKFGTTMDLCPICFKEFVKTYNLPLEEIDE